MSYISPSVQAVIDLFQGPLAELRFADVDISALASLARAADAAAAELAEHEARLSELKQVLADRQEALLVLAQRGLAYARVYAEQDEALSEQLSRINLPKAAKPRKPSAKPASAEPASAEPAMVQASTTPGSADSAEPRAEEPVLTAPLLDQSSADEPAHDDAPAEEPPVEVKATAKGKRRSGAREQAHSRAD